MALPRISSATILDTLSDLQKRQRRAQQLRGDQGSFKELAKKPGKGNYTPTQNGGLFETVAKYHKDWEGLGNGLTGAIGDYLTGKQGDKAENELNELRNGQVLGAVQQISAKDQDPLAQQPQSLNDYLGVQSAPKPAMPVSGMGGGLAAAAAAPPEIQSLGGGGQQATAASGEQAAATFPDLSPEANQRIATQAATMAQQGSPRPAIDFAVGESYKKEKEAMGLEMDMTAAPTTAGAADPPAGAPQMPQAGQPPAPPQMPAPGPPQMPAPGPPQMPPQGPPPDFMAAMGLPAGQFGVPETAPGAAMEAPGEAEAPLTDETLRAYLGLIGGEDMKDVLGTGRRLLKTVNLEGGKIKSYFSDGTSEISDDIAESKPRFYWDKGTGRIKKINSRTGDSEDVKDPITGEPLQMTREDALQRGVSEAKAVGTAQGEYDTRGQAADTAAAVAGGTALGKGEAETVVEARKGLPAVIDSTDKAIRDTDVLLNNTEGLDGLLTGLAGVVTNIPFDQQDTAANIYYNTVKKGTPEADAFAAHQQLTSKAFLQSYEDKLRGTGQVSNIEGLRAAADNLQNALYQSPKEYRRRLVEFKGEWAKIRKRIEGAAKMAPATAAGGGDAGSIADRWK